MTSQETALVELARLLTDDRIPYMVIGGLANTIWGEPRATIDIDVTVWALDPRIPEVVDMLGRHFTVLVEHPEAFIHETRVLPLESTSGVRIQSAQPTATASARQTVRILAGPRWPM